jgi:spoIIIJ-associated protein
MDRDQVKNIIEEFFTKSSCTLTGCEFSDEGGMLWCSLSTPDSRFLIGREGETLRAFNHIIRKMLEKEVGEEATQRLMIDINGYQRKRFDNLKTTAHMLAERARYFKSSIEADPMPASERRVIHLFLEEMKDIVTESTGIGKDRRVVIRYVENKDTI